MCDGINGNALIIDFGKIYEKWIFQPLYSLFLRHGYIVSPDYLKFYKVLMKEMLRERCLLPNSFEIWNKVNDIIFEVRLMLNQSGTRDKVFNSLQRIIYMAWMKFATKEHGLRSIHQKCCLSLVRYINYLPVDTVNDFS